MAQITIEKVVYNRWFLLVVVLLVIILIGSQTNWFGLAKPTRTGTAGRMANIYSGLNQDQMLELDRFRNELKNA